MIQVNDLRKQRAEKRSDMAALMQVAAKTGKDLVGDELKQYNILMADYLAIDAKLDQHAAGAFLPGQGAEPSSVIHVSGEQSFQAAQAGTSRNSSLSRQIQDVYAQGNSEVRAQLENLTNYMTGRPYDIRADMASAGGALIPSSVQDVLIRNFAQFDPVRQISKLFTTVSGEPLTFPVLSDSVSAVALAESAATGADATVSGDTPPTSLTGPQLHSYKTSSLPVFAAREYLEDTFAGGQFAGGASLIGELLAALIARIVRFENLKFSKGSGSGEQQGFITGATSYSAGAVALTLDVAMDLAYATPPLYRPNSSYMASDTTIKYLRKLHTGISGDNRSLWQNSFQDGNATKGTPPTLHGFPIYTNNDMDSVASDGTFASANVLAHGDFSRFLVREVSSFGSSLFVRRYEVPAKDGVALICFRRTDSKVLVPTAITKLVV